MVVFCLVFYNNLLPLSQWAIGGTSVGAQQLPKNTKLASLKLSFVVAHKKIEWQL
jgi:hypothetical protein